MRYLSLANTSKMVTHKQELSPTSTGIYAHIVGWGMAVPDTVLTNTDLEAIVETSDEWIRTRTGIRERRIASERESSASLGLKAARKALQIANIQPVDIDLIIVATSTPENIFPSTASLIQNWLGAGKAGAFDLSAACSGFVYGMDMATQSIRSGSIKTALVIGSETMSRVMDWQDRGTCIIFGDGAGAVVLKASTVQGGVLSAVLRSDGSGSDLLGIPTVGSIDLRNLDFSPDDHKMDKMFMNGSEVFKFATRVIGDSIVEALDKADLSVKDLSLIVPHQANARITQAAARALKVEADMFMSNIDKYGNTSAASIPIALCEAVEQGRIKPDQYLAFIGFGGGLTWASMVVKWSNVGALDKSPAMFISQQRREITYLSARWRVVLRRIGRQINNLFARVIPRIGRKSGDQSDID